MWALVDVARLWPQVVEVVPGMNNLTLVFDPLQADPSDLAQQMKTAWEQAAEVDVGTAEIEIPVRYGGPNGPDLAPLAKLLDLSIHELLNPHPQPHYLLFFLRFQPPFPSL